MDEVVNPRGALDMNTIKPKITSILKLIFILYCIGGAVVQAGQVTYPDDGFVAGNKLYANDLNTKFNQLKSAVNDNNAKTTLNSLICVSGQIAKWNGSAWTCQNDLTSAAGFISVAPHAFTSENTTATQISDCVLVKNEGAAYSFFLATGTNTSSACDANAGVQLPHGATLTSMSCKVFDNAGQPTPGLHMTAALRRINISAAASALVNIIFTTSSSIDSASEQIIIDTSPTIGYQVVDNSTYAYYVTMSYGTNDFSTATGYGMSQRFYGCSIAYN